MQLLTNRKLLKIGSEERMWLTTDHSVAKGIFVISFLRRTFSNGYSTEFMPH